MYHCFPKSVYCLLKGKIYYSIGVNSKLPLTKRERKPVLITLVTKIFRIIYVTCSDLVSYLINFIKPYIMYLTRKLTIKIKIVIKFLIKYPFQNSY